MLCRPWLHILCFAVQLHLGEAQMRISSLQEAGVPNARNFGVLIDVNVTDVIAKPSLAAAVVDALWGNGFILFRDQLLTPQEEAAFTRLFPFDSSVAATKHGPQGEHESQIYQRWRIPGAEEVQVQGYGTLHDHFGLSGDMHVSAKEAREWHVDAVYESMTPSAVSCMLSVKTPEFGGETLFVSGVSGYAHLPTELRQQAERTVVHYTRTPKPMRQDGLRAVGRSDAENATQDPKTLGMYNVEGVTVADRYENASVSTQHPLVWEHPFTGAHSVCASPMWTHHVTVNGNDLSVEESQDFLARILSHFITDDHIYAHRWAPGDFACFDHSSVLHSATPTSTHGPGERINHRTRLQGARSPGNPFLRLQDLGESCRVDAAPGADGITSDF